MDNKTIDVHKLWRWEMLKNFVILVLVLYILQITSLIEASLMSIMGGILTYVLFYYTKKGVTDNPRLINEIGEHEIRLALVKHLLSSLSWFILSAILYVLYFVHSFHKIVHYWGIK